MYANKILVFGLNDDQISDVNKYRPTKETEVVATDCATDLIAIPCCAIIVNGAAMSNQQADDIRWYYEDVGDYAERMLVIGEQDRLKGLGRASLLNRCRISQHAFDFNREILRFNPFHTM